MTTYQNLVLEKKMIVVWMHVSTIIFYNNTTLQGVGGLGTLRKNRSAIAVSRASAMASGRGLKTIVYCSLVRVPELRPWATVRATLRVNVLQRRALCTRRTRWPRQGRPWVQWSQLRPAPRSPPWILFFSGFLSWCGNGNRLDTIVVHSGAACSYAQRS